MTEQEKLIIQSIKEMGFDRTVYRRDLVSAVISKAIQAFEQTRLAEGDRAISLNEVKGLFCRICMESNLCYRSKETCEDLKLFDKLPPVNLQESSRDMEEIEEVINCDADAETKCKMISNILTAKPHYFKKQEHIG